MSFRERSRRVGWAAGLLGVVGCYPVWKTVPGEEESGTGSSGGAVTTGGTHGTSGGLVTTGVVVPGSSGGSSGVGSSTEGGSFGSSGFVPEPDAPWEQYMCDVWAQDCPPGEKCSAYASDGGSGWNALKCVPVMENPAGVGEECFVVGNEASGIDNCEFGAFCWDIDAENKGTCVALCTGMPESPMCEPGFTCPISSHAVLTLCLPTCDPLAQDCEDPNDLCIGSPSDVGFICVIDASGEEGQAHDPCEYANACDPGLLCLNSVAAVECDPAASGCCEPFCDVTKPNMCPGVGQVCNPYYEVGLAPPEYENVGVCAVPQ